VSVLDVHGGPLWVTVVLGLGGVLQTLVRLDDELALSSLHDDATLHVHEGSGLGGAGGDLAALATDTSAVSTLHWTVHFIIGLDFLHQLGKGVCGQHTLGHAHTTLHAIVLAGLAHWLATEQSRDAHIAHGAGARLAWATDWALGADGAAVHLSLLAAHAAPVGTRLAGSLGADRSWDTGSRVGQGALGAAWALHVGRLGVVHSRALVGLGEVFAVRRHVNNSTLLVQKLGGGFGSGGTTTGHFVL